jgi:signal peptide peptidase SppA
MTAAALSTLGNAIETGDPDSIKAALSFGGEDGVESTMKVVNGVAIIPVNGVLRDAVDYMVRWGEACSYQLLERDFQSAIGNDLIKSIAFYFDTPGGSAVGCKRMADVVHAARGKKPIVAYVQGQCCSAGYYIAAACDRIEATADSLVGSVGTIMPHVEMSGYLDEIGFGVTVITNADSPKKGHGNQYEKLTPEAKATLQGFIDSFGKSFISDVALYRGESVETVIATFGQGDAFRADAAVQKRMVDAVVTGFSQTLASLPGSSQQATPVVQSQNPIILPVAAMSASTAVIPTPEAAPAATLTERLKAMKISAKVRAQLFACSLIVSMEASDEACIAALNGWFRGSVPANESKILKGLRNAGSAKSPKSEEDDEEPKEEDDDEEITEEDEDEEPKEEDEEEPKEEDDDDEEEKPASSRRRVSAKARAAKAHRAEHSEARLGDLKASANLVNKAAGYDAISAEMVIIACEARMSPKAAMKSWAAKLGTEQGAVSSPRIRVTGKGSDKFVTDAVDAMVYRATGKSKTPLSDGAKALVNRPLWAIAHQSLALAGSNVDMYGDRELIADQAMQMGDATRRTQFFSSNEDQRYVQAASPFSRPGDFPNILSGLANKYLDTIELDDDYSYEKISAVLPGGLNDFKPAMMVNRGIVEEMDEISDGEQLKDLGLAEEVLSYVFLRRFGNRFGWTPVMIANDDLGAFAEGMIGLDEAWQVTQNRLVLDRYTSSETLLDGSALFADRANTGTGTIPAANNNLRGSGLAPSDAEWGAMSTLYAGIGGINTGRRVRGTLNTILVPTNGVHQSAVRTFETYPVIGETKVAATDSNLGIYRNKVQIVPESELNSVNATAYYGLRSPTMLNTATVVRAYFNGYGTAGRRERWYDPENKTTYVSLEGRIAVATKNWRYAVKNAGTGG